MDQGLTLYDEQGFQVANSLNRFAVSSWMPFQNNPDGSLDLYFQNESPGAEKEANWLPAPKGPFNLLHASLCSEVRSADWQMEPATGHEGPGAPGLDDAIKGCWSVHG
jgi:hypothetical protein